MALLYNKTIPPTFNQPLTSCKNGLWLQTIIIIFGSENWKGGFGPAISSWIQYFWIIGNPLQLCWLQSTPHLGEHRMVRYKQVGPFPGEVYKLAVVGQVLDLQGDQTGLADTGLGVPQTVVLYIALRRLRQELGHLLERTPVFLRVLCDRWKIVNMYWEVS